jgi:DNA-binding response OmpR family regulator
MKKILVIDDEQPICKMLEKFLSRKGYQAITALSGEEGIKKVKKEKPQIVLLDIKMPGIDGIETLERIRKIDKKVGVIMITVINEDEVGRKCMKLGAYDYITKPFNLDYLESALLVKLLDFKN